MGEQIGFVRAVDHYLHTFANAAEAGFDNRRVNIHAVSQLPRVPGYLMRIMAQEIFCVELRPEQFIGFGSNGIQT